MESTRFKVKEGKAEIFWVKTGTTFIWSADCGVVFIRRHEMKAIKADLM
jgi:hypothetical protein